MGSVRSVEEETVAKDHSRRDCCLRSASTSNEIINNNNQKNSSINKLEKKTPITGKKLTVRGACQGSAGRRNRTCAVWPRARNRSHPYETETVARSRPVTATPGRQRCPPGASLTPPKQVPVAALAVVAADPTEDPALGEPASVGERPRLDEVEGEA